MVETDHPARDLGIPDSEGPRPKSFCAGRTKAQAALVGRELSWGPQGTAHLRDRRGLLHLYLCGASELWVGGVQDLHSQAQHEAGTEGHALTQALVQVLVLVQQCVVACGAVHVHPGRAQRG